MSESVKAFSDISSTIIADLETAFNNDYNITQACHYAKIDRQTYYNYLRDPIFAEHMEVARNMPLRKSREIVIKAISDGDANLAFKYLTVRDPDFKTKSEVAFNPDLETTREKLKEFLDEPDELEPNEDLPDDIATPTGEDTDETS